jgi:mannonate dehydratase
MWQPLLCENVPDVSDRTLRWAAQLGLQALALPGRLADPEGKGYWTEAGCRTVAERVEAAGLRVGIMMFNLSPQVVWGRPGRDEGIEHMRRSIRAAGAAGYPVVEYNFYNHRAVEGYGQRPGRGGCRYTDYEDARLQALGPDPQMPDPAGLTAEETWAHLEYLLRAVVPVADEVGVRLALHPNDPPVPAFRGVAQPLRSLADFERLIETVDSPANCLFMDTGVVTEMGEDAAAAIRTFGARDRIGFVHYRNVRVDVPSERYTEVFFDEGDGDMAACMAAFAATGYTGAVEPDHTPGIDGDTADTWIGWAFAVGQIRALRDAAAGGHLR